MVNLIYDGGINQSTFTKVKDQWNRFLEIKKHISELGCGADFKDKCKNVKLDINGKEIETQISCREITDGLNHQSLRFIQFQEKIAREKQYTTKNIYCNELFTFDQIIGKSSLIHGESGTGKEMFAQAIHSASNRKSKPFIAINCGAIPQELVESELFGYEEGSFTGALKGGKLGKIEAASGGTLFLDEIESMPVQDQVKLLRVLSTEKIQKIGSTKEISVDIRLISATKIDLLDHADKGLFREDLFYRISTFIIQLPPLRERKDDIIVLAKKIIKKLTTKYSRPPVGMDRLFINTLKNYCWRGNTRELEHALEYAVITLRDEPILRMEHLPENIQDAWLETTPNAVIEEVMRNNKGEKGLLKIAERMLIERVLESVDGNVSLAAEQLGVHRRTLYNKQIK